MTQIRTLKILQLSVGQMHMSIFEQTIKLRYRATRKHANSPL